MPIFGTVPVAVIVVAADEESFFKKMIGGLTAKITVHFFGHLSGAGNRKALFFKVAGKNGESGVKSGDLTRGGGKIRRREEVILGIGPGNKAKSLGGEGEKDRRKKKQTENQQKCF